MIIRRSLDVWVYGTYDEFTKIMREYEMFVGHAATEQGTYRDAYRIMRIGELSDEFYVTLYHMKG